MIRVRPTVWLVAALGAVVGCGGGSVDPTATVPQKPTYAVGGLHPTYENVNALREEADVVVEGTFGSQRTVEPDPLPTDPDGAVVHGVPWTDLNFEVGRVAKGAAELVGSTIVVRRLGGESEHGVYVVEDLGEIVAGATYLVFLRRGADDRYYLLAGDGAAAARSADGAYELPEGVTGEASVVVSAADVGLPTPIPAPTASPSATPSAPTDIPAPATPAAQPPGVATGPATKPLAEFALNARQLRWPNTVGRTQRTVTVRIRDLPAGSRVRLVIERIRRANGVERREVVGVSTVTARGGTKPTRVNAAMSAAARSSMRTRRLKRLFVRVEVSPPGRTTASSERGLRVR